MKIASIPFAEWPRSCPACHAAWTNPNAGEYRSGCWDCEVRAVSHAPKALRDRFYAQIGDIEERLEFRLAVVAEYERRLRLRGVTV